MGKYNKNVDLAKESVNLLLEWLDVHKNWISKSLNVKENKVIN